MTYEFRQILLTETLRKMDLTEKQEMFKTAMQPLLNTGIRSVAQYLQEQLGITSRNCIASVSLCCQSDQ